MSSLQLTLLCDGTSDRALIPIVEKLFDQHSNRYIQIELARNLPASEKTLRQRIDSALRLYPCDLLIVHRDAEGQPKARLAQIDADTRNLTTNHVVAMPVKMTEAWLLTSEQAIRDAVGNSNGRAKLEIPIIQKIEDCDAKSVLFYALRQASELGAHRLAKFQPEQYRHRVAELLSDLARLRKLKSFQHFEQQVIAFCKTHA